MGLTHFNARNALARVKGEALVICETWVPIEQRSREDGGGFFDAALRGVVPLAIPLETGCRGQCLLFHYCRDFIGILCGKGALNPA